MNIAIFSIVKKKMRILQVLKIGMKTSELIFFINETRIYTLPHSGSDF